MSIGNISTVATWIAGLTITGVTIKDLSGIPEVIYPQDCPLLVPDVNAPYLQDVQYERLSFRTAAAGRANRLDYSLNYVYYHAPVLEGVDLFEHYEALADAWSAIMTVIVADETPSGAYDIRPAGTPYFGLVRATDETPFHGCRFQLNVIEFS